MAVSIVLYLYVLRNVGIANDEWTWLLYRMRGFGSIFDPYNSQPIVGQVLLYRLWANTVGVAHHWALDLVYLSMHGAIAALVFQITRRRVGPWAALGVAVLVLALGRAWETVLFPGCLSFMLPALAACVAWASLERQPRPLARMLVAVLLALASVSGGLGIAIAAGLAIELALERHWSQLWMLVPAIVAMIAWYAAEAGRVMAHPGKNLPHVPLWAAKFLSAAAGAAIGASAAVGVAVVLVGVAFAVTRARSQAGEFWSPRGVGLLTTLLATALVTGAARASDTPATSSRYLYFPAIVMLMLVCEWSAGIHLLRRRLGVLAGVVVVLVAMVLAVQQLRDGKGVYLRASDGTATRMGAMRLVDGPRFLVEPSGLAYGPAQLDAFIHAFGTSPIDTEAQLSGALPESRSAVDNLLASVDVRPASHLRGCHAQPAGGPIALRSGPVRIRAAVNTRVQLVRFAPIAASVAIPVRAPGLSLRLRADPISHPWRLIPTDATVQHCV